LQRAQGGTLFLGEVADVPLPTQIALAGILQRESENPSLALRARVVATSTQPLDAAVQSGLVRPELAYRLAVVTLRVPPLRERREDIALLIEHFLTLFAPRSLPISRALGEHVFKQLLEHSWPGNVRELRNVLESAALLSDGARLDNAIRLRQCEAEPSFAYRLPLHGVDLRQLEREVLLQALKLTAGNQTRAAVLLGLTRDQIRYRMSKFGIMNRDASGTDDRAA
jgi:DNA-binding NtrC family response regulator